MHSVAILPQFQRQGLGRTILKAYVQRMESSGICDRIALLAHEEMIRFYENSGFRNQGKSEVKFGGGGWSDMVSGHNLLVSKASNEQSDGNPADLRILRPMRPL